MTEHQFEHRAEQDAVSPELGFSLGVVPTYEAAQLLREGSMKTAEAEDFELGLSTFDTLLREGVPARMWRRYAALATFDMDVFENAPNAEVVKAKFAAAVSEAASASVQFLEDHIQYLHGFIQANPGVFVRGVDALVRLEGLHAEWFDDQLDAIPDTPPITLIAHWSDGSSKTMGSGDEMHIALDLAPQEIQDAARAAADV